MNNKQTELRQQRLVYDFRRTRELVAEFILEHAETINVNAITGQDERVYRLSSSIEHAVNTGREDRVREAIAIMTEQLSQHLLCGALVRHFKSVPDTYDNGLFDYGAKMLIRDLPVYRTEAELMLATVQHVPLNEILTGWFDSLIRHFCRTYFKHIDEWRTVDTTLKGDRLVVTVGEDLRHVIFRQTYGAGRWSGPYVLPDGDAIP